MNDEHAKELLALRRDIVNLVRVIILDVPKRVI